MEGFPPFGGIRLWRKCLPLHLSKWVALGPRTQGYFHNLTLTLSLKGRGIEVGADLRVCPDSLEEHIDWGEHIG